LWSREAVGSTATDGHVDLRGSCAGHRRIEQAILDGLHQRKRVSTIPSGGSDPGPSELRGDSLRREFVCHGIMAAGVWTAAYHGLSHNLCLCIVIISIQQPTAAWQVLAVDDVRRLPCSPPNDRSLTSSSSCSAGDHPVWGSRKRSIEAGRVTVRKKIPNHYEAMCLREGHTCEAYFTLCRAQLAGIVEDS